MSLLLVCISLLMGVIIKFHYQFCILEKNKTIPLRGILAICIVLHHLSVFVDNVFIDQFHRWGAIIVAVFFFLSGYGLWKSWLVKKKEYLKNFLIHRIFKALLLPFLLYTLVYRLLFYSKLDSFFESLKKAVLLGDVSNILPNSWFVFTILFMYLVFYLICKNCKSNRVVLSLIAIASLGYLLGTIYLNYPGCWYVSALAFPVGVLYSHFEDRFIHFLSISHRMFYISFVPVCLLIVAICFLMNTVLGKVIAFPLMAVMIVFLCSSLKIEKLASNSAFLFLSGISYEIYLCHGIVMKFLRGDYIYISSDIIFICLTFFVTLVLAYTGKKILALLYKK